jgi:TPR repeat protein
MYEQGFGVQADAQEAMFWNRKAAEQGERMAQLQLAKALETKNRDEAMKWYRAAARQELPDAQLRLAQMHFERPNRHCKEAITWYERASENGVAQAMYELATIYQLDECGVRDLTKAYIWSQTGARYGSKEARAEAGKLAPMFTDSQRRVFALRIDAWARKHTGADRYEDEEEKDER